MLKLKLFHNNVVTLSKGLLKRFLKLNCVFLKACILEA